MQPGAAFQRIGVGVEIAYCSCNIKEHNHHGGKYIQVITMRPLILRLEITGHPVRWVPWQEAVTLRARNMIAWDAGDTVFTFRGGINRLTGTRSEVSVSSIIAVAGTAHHPAFYRAVPPLSNRQLFSRDQHLCMYCGEVLAGYQLTRDHVIPLSRGGRDYWSNVVAACKSCNHRKGAHTPEEAGMRLLAVPYVPNRAEYLALSNRRILADQMDFLKKRFATRNRLRRIL